MSGRGGVPGFPRKEEEPEDRRFGGGGGWSGHGDYMRDKEEKLAEQYAASVTRRSDVLRGVVLHIDGVSTARQFDLSDLVVAHGGRYMQYLHGSAVTHLLANNLPAAKIAHVLSHIAEARRRGRSVHCVREAWLVEAINIAREAPQGRATT